MVELRINTKSSGGKLPNFGFVVFDDPEPVQKILSSKVMYNNNNNTLPALPELACFTLIFEC